MSALMEKQLATRESVVGKLLQQVSLLYMYKEAVH